MAIIPDFTQLTDLAGTDWLTGWDLSESEMFKISVDDFLDNVIGSNFQAASDNLDALSALDNSLGNIIIGTGSGFSVFNEGTIIRSDADLSISNRGVYLFFGSTPRTFTLQDGIVGPVEIRTIASADLTVDGKITSSFLGTIYTGNVATVFRWDATTSTYLI